MDVFSYKKIEEKELHYFNQLFFTLNQDIPKMIEALNSKDKIRDDWIKVFQRADKKRQNSDFARGAERVYFWLLTQFGTPNSSPVGADLMFETYDAFVHIDIKTAKLRNTSDYKGKIPISENQTSYYSKNFKGNLPFFYNCQESSGVVKKVCLTYVLNIVYDEEKNFKIIAVILIAVPNGQLKKYYGDEIIAAGKNKNKSFRFKYINNPYFITSKNKEKKKRFCFLYLDSAYKKEFQKIKLLD